MKSLEELLKPLIQTCYALELQPATTTLPLTASKFGGQPYLENGESWPQCPTCNKPLAFICQLDLRQTNHPLRADIPFFTFYYCWECFPWGFPDDAAGQWVVRLYEDPKKTKASTSQYPSDMDFNTECQVLIHEQKSLPDWEGTQRWCPEASELACELNSESPWEAYQQAVEQLVGEEEFNSRIGGYPKWVQGEETPEDSILLAQIDSEDEAGIMWGDVGCVYLFLAKNLEAQISLKLQCC